VKRIWPIRLIEFSPLIVLALILAVWFGVPASLRTLAIESALSRALPEVKAMGYDTVAVDLEYEALQRLESEEQTNTVYTDDQSASGRLRAAADSFTARAMQRADDLYDAAGHLKPYALPESNPAFEGLRRYEDESGARVAVFVMPPDPSPPVAVRAIESTAVLTTEELRELETSGTLESLRRTQRGPRTTAYPVDVEGLNGGTGSPYGKRDIFYSPKLIGGHVYEVYTVYPKRGEGLLGETLELPDPSDVTAPANVRAVKRAARRGGGAAFIIGPTDGPLVPLRIPRSLSEDKVLAALEDRADRPFGSVWEGIAGLTAKTSTELGGAKWVGTALSSRPVGKPSGDDVRQPLAFVALFDSSPEVPLAWERFGKTPRRLLQVWLSAHMLFVAGALAVAFLASLVASPLAFIYERRQTEELELERERERVRRQARDRVIARLTDLSERVDAVAAAGSAGPGSDVQKVAGDIDATVSELRAILGELSERDRSADA
jgi:hypothetical protein